MADAGHGKGVGGDAGQHVEIDEAVVKRRNQRVGHEVRQPRQKRVLARRIDDYSVVAVGEPGDGVGKLRVRGDLVLGARNVQLLEADMGGRGRLLAALACPGEPILDIAGEAALPAIEVDGGYASAGLQQRAGDMDGDGFPDPPFSLATTMTRTLGARDKSSCIISALLVRGSNPSFANSLSLIRAVPTTVTR